MNRRRMLLAASSLFGVAAAPAQPPPPLPPPAEEGDYWERVRSEQFLLPGWRAFLNNGSLGVAPRPVVHAIADYLNRSAALLMDDCPRWGYETLDDMRQELASFFGCDKDELALTHNATEAMNTIANGLDLKEGDEVVLTDQEHPSGLCPWLQKQARFGVRVREVKIPLPPSCSKCSTAGTASTQ